MALRVRPRVWTGVALAAAVGMMCTAFSTASSADPTTPAGAPEPPKPVTVSLKNDCEFPVGGKQVITSDLTARLPKTATVGQPVDIEQVKVRFAIPEAMVKALRDSGIATIEGFAYINVGTEDKQAVQVTVAIPKTALPDTGDLTVEQDAQTVPSAPVTKAGNMTFTVQPLTTLFVPRNAAGEAQNADAKQVNCTLEDGQDGKLGVVTVVPATTNTPSASATPSEETGPSTAQAPGQDPKAGPGKKIPRKNKVRRLDDPNGSSPCATDPPPDASGPWTYYRITGKVIIKKVQGTVTLGPGFMGAHAVVWNIGDGVLCNTLQATLSLPQTMGNFIAFNFLPTGSAITITQPQPAHGVLDELGPGVLDADATTVMSVDAATVNGLVNLVGTPGKTHPVTTGTVLDVGPNCKAVVNIHLTSELDKWQALKLDDDGNRIDSGDIDAKFGIREFTGCGVTEDLNPLLKGLIGSPVDPKTNEVVTDDSISLHFGPVVFCFEVPDYPGDGDCTPPLDQAQQQPQQQARKAVKRK